MTGGGFLSRLIAFGISVYLARVAGVAGFGAIGSALAFVAYFKVIVNAGLEPYAMRDTARHHDMLPSIYARVVGTRLLLALMCSLLILLLLLVLPERITQHTNLILIYGFILFTEALTTVWAIRSLEKMKLIAMGLVGQHIFMAAGIFLFLKGPDPNLWVVPVVQVSSLVAMQAWYYWKLRSSFKPLYPSFDYQNVVSTISASFPVALGKIMRLFYYQGDVLLLALIATQASAGEFLASHKIILAGVMIGATYQVNAYPTTSRLSLDNPADAVAFQTDILRYAFVAVMPALVIGAYYSEPLILLLYGNEYANSSKILFYMLFTVPLVIAIQGMQNLLLSVGAGRYHFLGNSVSAISHLLLALVTIPRYGSVGAAYACLAAEVLCVITMAIFVRRKLGGYPWQHRLFAPIAAAVMMVIALSITDHAGLSIPTQLVSAIASYSFGTFILKSLSNQELSYIISHIQAFVVRNTKSKA